MRRGVDFVLTARRKKEWPHRVREGAKFVPMQ
jgi:hypothetical protein